MIGLRDFLTEDEELLVSYLNEDSVTEYLSARLSQPYTKEAATWWVNTGSKIGIAKAITKNGVLVGSISAIRGEFERQKSAEVGYWVAKPYWGKGIASEALAEFSKALFLNTDLVRLYASVFEGNTASAKVLEKCGFKLEAIFEKAIYKDGLFFNEYHYANVRTTN
ncbi:MAG TPA: GNAT family protein [Cellvibrio sp.]|nr:GNAT family protein [Cellvibrio sp.]